jgi:hypothetical protein
VKGVKHVLQHGWKNRGTSNLPTLDEGMEAFRNQLSSVTKDYLQTSETPSDQYDAGLEGQGSFAGSRWIMRHTDVERLKKCRRQNYEKWAKTVADLPHCRALFPILPDDCVPYMFPLFIEHPGVHFLALRCLGVTVWRWDDMAVSNCPVAMAYRLQLLHLPCHQELTSHQMDWMTAAMSEVMTRIPS